MLIEMLQGKLHRGVVTATRLDYPGSLTVDLDLIEQSGLREYQKVQVLNLTNGNRLETYLIRGTRGSRELIVNGAAAHLNKTGDRVIVAGFAHYDPAELHGHKPTVLVLDERNQVVERH